MRMIRVGEKRERLRRKTENERKFGKKIAKNMTVNRKDDELALLTRRKVEIFEARANVEATNKEENVGARRKIGKKRTLQEFMVDNQKRTKKIKESWKKFKETIENIEDLEGWKNDTHEEAKEDLIEGVDAENVDVDFVKKLDLMDSNLLTDDGHRERVRGEGGHLDQDCQEVQARLIREEDFPNQTNAKNRQPKMTHNLVNFNLKISGGNQNWTRDYNPGGNPRGQGGI